MRIAAVASLWLITHVLPAQNLPLNLEWSAFLPYGSYGSSPSTRVCIDGPRTAWMLQDDLMMESTTSDMVVRRYDTNGLPMDGSVPHMTFGCGTLDHPIAFSARNDSVWGLMRWSYISGPITYCLTTPAGGYAPTAIITFGMEQRATDIHIDGLHCIISASHDSTFTARHQRLTKVDVAGAPVWDMLYPTDQFQGFSRVESVAGGNLLVADLPQLHWFSSNNGDLLSSISLYSGASTMRGDIKIWNGEIYWATTEGSTVHYGRTAFNGTPVWSSTILLSDVTKLTVDDEGRMWLVGTHDGQGVLSVIDTNGDLIGTWNYGAALSDIDFGNAKITITGAMVQADPDVFMITGTPDL